MIIPAATHTETPDVTIPLGKTFQRYEITHRTRFTYSQPVSLDQMVVRLQPRASHDQRLVRFDIDCQPAPAKHTHCLDLHGNIRHWFWFEKEHSSLTITTHSTVDCLCDNPFDFIVVDPGVEQLPAVYDEPVFSASSHYRQRTSIHPAVDALAEQIMRQAEGNTLAFLWDLAQFIQCHVRQIIRHHGAPWEPVITLQRGEGACRDAAVLFIDACRAMGLAARFVSGYAFDAKLPQQRELHAWAEVYLPGAGWKGYDPTIGLAVADRHVAVAASPNPAYAAPTAGTFTVPGVTVPGVTGPRVDTTLDYHIEMTRTELSTSPHPHLTFAWH